MAFHRLYGVERDSVGIITIGVAQGRSQGGKGGRLPRGPGPESGLLVCTLFLLIYAHKSWHLGS